MQYEIIIAALLAASPALAFTNGSLVPPYVCNPNADGLPKSFGQLLTFTKEQTPQVAFSTNTGQNVKAPQLAQTNGQTIGNSAYILASMHDSPNSIKSINQGIQVRTANNGPIVAGQPNMLILSTGKTTVALKGALLYARDTTGTPQGSFTDKSGANTFVPFPGCGMNPQGQLNGVIQGTGVSATSTYSSLVYNAPNCVSGNNITLGGLSVTGAGFGTWTQSFTVSGSSCSGSGGSGSGSGSTTNQGTGSSSGTTKSGTGSSGKKGAAGQASSSVVAAAQSPSASASASVSAIAQAVQSAASGNTTASASSAAKAGKGKWGKGRNGGASAGAYAKTQASNLPCANGS